jgi:hypothetical protein
MRVAEATRRRLSRPLPQTLAWGSARPGTAAYAALQHFPLATAAHFTHMAFVQCSKHTVSGPLAATSKRSFVMAKFQFDSAKVKVLFADVQEKAKVAREKADGRRAELVQFNKDNVEALKAAGKVMVEGAKPLANDAVANTRKQIDAVVANVKDLKGKKPAELVKVQGEFAKAQFAVARDDAKAFGESCVRLGRDAVAPIKVRVAAVRERAAA